MWPDEDLPRTHTLKVRKPDILARLDELARPASAPLPAAASKVQPDPLDADIDPITVIVAGLAGVPADVGRRLRHASRPTSSWILSSGWSCWASSRRSTGVFLDDDALLPDDHGGRAGRAGGGRARRQARAGRLALAAARRSCAPRAWPSRSCSCTRSCTCSTGSGHGGWSGLPSRTGQYLLTPNHCLHLDNAIILSRLPFAIRWKLAVAAAADTIYANPVRGVLASVIANAFPLQREGGVRKSLELLGSRMDHGYNVLLYPEGKLTVGGPLQPFKPGRRADRRGGRHADRAGQAEDQPDVDHRPPPVPISLRGDVELVVGAPIWFDSTMDHAAATSRLEAAVAEL